MSVFGRLWALLSLCCLLTGLLGGCLPFGGGKTDGEGGAGGALEDVGVTRIELENGWMGDVKDVYFMAAEPTFSDIYALKNVSAKVYAGNTILNTDTGLKQAVRWVSSDPGVVTVAAVQKKAYSTEDVRYLELTVNESVVAEGIYEIYAENFDGSVKSRPIKLVIGAPPEAVTGLELGLAGSVNAKTDAVTFASSDKATEAQRKLKIAVVSFGGEQLDPGDIWRRIRWVSSNPAAVSVTAVQPKYSFDGVVALLTLEGEGVADIYAETEDGLVQSNRLTVAFGNEYNKEFLATDFAANYVLDHLRYKTKTSEYLPSALTLRKTYFVQGAKMKIGYSQFADTSTVECASTLMEGDTATVKGIVETYTETFSSIRFSFAVKVKCVPESNYTSFEVLSSNYELPQYVVQDVDIIE